MWMRLAVSVLVATMLCYVPGYVFFRGLGFSPVVALCTAPLYSVCLYAVLPIAYCELGVSCGPVTMVVPTLGIALCCYGIARIRRNESASADLLRYGPASHDPRIPALYVGLAAVACMGVFVLSIAGPDAFYDRFDNQVHLNLVRSFLDSGTWSSLHASNHLASPRAAWPITGNGEFYPAAWHDIVALVCSLCGVSVPVGNNALIIVTCAVMLPLGSYALVASLFPRHPRAIALGAVATVGFANWPWLTITGGPLYPLALGLSLLPGALAVIIASATSAYAQRHKLVLACFAVCSLAALALAHPSVVFSAYVICAGFGAHVLWQLVTAKASGRARRAGIMLAYAALIALVWFALYHVRALQSTLNYNTDDSLSLPHALASLLSLRFSYASVQLGMIVACAAGFVALWRGKDARWLIVPIAFFALAYLFSRMNTPVLEHWICGPWYSDMRRLCQNLTVLLIPVAAIGMETIREALATRFGTRAGTAAVAAIVAITLIPGIWLPGMREPIVWGLGMPRGHVRSSYGDAAEHVYGRDEVEFVDRATELMPPGALVINAPADGSAWAYAVNGTNTYYRTIRTRNLTDDARLIQAHLSEYATNPQVREAVQRIGATYVLLLDQGVLYEDGIWLPQYSAHGAKKWTGITSIDDNTPGFTPVLADGDMRLYRIDA